MTDTLDKNITKLGQLLDQAKTVLVLQPEKPDTDSLTAALTLEQLIGDQGKEVVMYCQDEVPRYIAYFEGADRVSDEFPDHYDLAILVDTGGPQQMSRTLEKYVGRLSKKPFVIIDHHPKRTPMPFETIDIVAQTNATGEVIEMVADKLGWKVTAAAASLIVPGLLADTLNFSIHSLRPEALETAARMMRYGADIGKIHEDYRKVDALTPELLELKGRLLSRLELYGDGKIALIMVSPEELKQYAEIHDPSDLVIYELQRARGVQVAVVMRNYGGLSKKIKVPPRANMPVAAATCAQFGGGGHDRAAGCQFNDTPIAEAKDQFVAALSKQICDYESTHTPAEQPAK